jgi:predicted nucleic acid-binding protein
MKVLPPSNPRHASTFPHDSSVARSPGEVEAIAMAIELRAAWLIVDDGDARRVALTLGLRIIGVLGMIVWAKQHGKVANALDCIAELRRITRFRISDEVLERIAIDLGESP